MPDVTLTVIWIHVSSIEGRRGLTNIEDSVEESIQRLDDRIKNAGDDWLKQPEKVLSKRENLDMDRKKET